MKIQIKAIALPTGKKIEVFGVGRIPTVKPGDDLSQMILSALQSQGLVSLDKPLQPYDVIVIAQKIISKAEGRLVKLSDVAPSRRAQDLAQESGKDARLVELILSETLEVMRVRQGLIIVRDRRGFVLANAGIDRSNIGDEDTVLLLPLDPDASAKSLQAKFKERLGGNPAVLISDSFGRPWRQGTTNVAIGAAGFPVTMDFRGQPDLYGRTMESTIVGFADAVTAAAGMVIGEGSEGCPVALVRGLSWASAPADAKTILRPQEQDLFL